MLLLDISLKVRAQHVLIHLNCKNRAIERNGRKRFVMLVPGGDADCGFVDIESGVDRSASDFDPVKQSQTWQVRDHHGDQCDQMAKLF